MADYEDIEVHPAANDAFATYLHRLDSDEQLAAIASLLIIWCQESGRHHEEALSILEDKVDELAGDVDEHDEDQGEDDEPAEEEER